MKLSTKIILPIIIISALLILLNGCISTVPDDSPGFTPGTITGIIASPCCENSVESADGDTTSPEYWCYYCQNTWKLQDGIEVVLTYGEDEVAATTTNDKGEFTFTNVDPGKNYVITAYCPDYKDNRPLVKDVALELLEGGSFDTKITDLVSTSLGLVVDFLVNYTEMGPEDISLIEVIADKPSFPNFPKFKKLVYEVRRVLENCEVNMMTDDELQDALCLASEEVGRVTFPDLVIGCVAGYTPPPGPPPPPPPPGECDGDEQPIITDVKQDGLSIFDMDLETETIILIAGTPYEFCVTATDTDLILPQDLIYYLTIDGVAFYSISNSNCLTITPEAGDVDNNPHEVSVNVYDGCLTTTWGPVTVIVDCCPLDEPGLTIDFAQTMGIEMSNNRVSDPADISICMDECTTINSVTIHYGGTNPLPDLIITDFLNDTILDWDIPAGIDFTKTTNGATVCLLNGVQGTEGTYTIGVSYTDSCDNRVEASLVVTFEDCSCIAPTVEADGPYTKTVCPGTAATIDFDSTVTLGTGPFTYDWDFGDGSLHGTIADPSHIYPIGADVYNVTLVVTNACGDSTYNTTVTITESVAVTANAGPDQSEVVCPGANALIDLVGSGTGNGTLSYSWDFGNGGTTEDSTEQDPQDVAFGKGTYTVTLTVTDNCGSATDTMIVTITECINNAPYFTNLPPTTQKVNLWQTYTYDVNATDDDLDTLTYSLTTSPNGMEINPSTGVITWTCANCYGILCSNFSLEVKSEGSRCHWLCNIPVTVRVTSGGCCGPLFDEESFIVEVWQP